MSDVSYLFVRRAAIDAAMIKIKSHPLCWRMKIEDGDLWVHFKPGFLPSGVKITKGSTTLSALNELLNKMDAWNNS